jgi:hypothetical protein
VNFSSMAVADDLGLATRTVLASVSLRRRCIAPRWSQTATSSVALLPFLAKRVAACFAVPPAPYTCQCMQVEDCTKRASKRETKRASSCMDAFHPHRVDGLTSSLLRMGHSSSPYARRKTSTPPREQKIRKVRPFGQKDMHKRSKTSMRPIFCTK